MASEVDLTPAGKNPDDDLTDDDDAAVAAPAGSDEQRAAAMAFLLMKQSRHQEAVALVAQHPQIWHEVDDEGHTLLHWAALSGSEEGVKQAIASNMSADLPSQKSKQTPFMWAVIRGHIQVSKLLLEAKADPYAKDSFGATPLILAVQYKQHEAMLLLFAWASPPKLLGDTDVKGCTPVHWAAYKGDLSSLRMLEYFDADCSKLDDQRMSPLHRAVQASSWQVCEFLVERGCDPTLPDAEGLTPLDAASKKGDLMTVRTLKKLMADRGLSTSSTCKDAARDDGAVVIQDKTVDDVEIGGRSSSPPRPPKDDLLQFKRSLSGYAAPCFWLVSVSFSVFQYLVDVRTVSWEQQPSLALAFEILVVMSLALFFYVAQADPGKVPPRAKGSSGVEEVMKVLKAGSQEAVSSDAPSFSKLCTTTYVLKGHRVKYCQGTGACVEEFDHFCGWLNVAIGKGNHRGFVVLAAVEATTQLCNFLLCWTVASTLVKGEGFGDWMVNVATTFPAMLFLMVLHILTGPPVVFLFLNHLRLIWMNMTTNELLNAHRYSHFWEEVGTPPKKVFRNPYDKGGMFLNCLDFWWTRRRSELGPVGSPARGVSVAPLSA